MDNFFQIIFILFIIISIVSSFLEKKRKQAGSKPKGKPEPQNNLQRKLSRPKREIKEKQREFLAEVLGLEYDDSVKNKVVSVEEKEPNDVQDFRTWNPEEEFEEAEQHLEKEEERSEQISKIDLDKDVRLAKEIPEFKDKPGFAYSSSTKSKGANLLAQSIRKKLRRKKTIREYILVSEILGKPKALRR